MASIELCKIVKQYDKHQVIKPLDLKIEDGAFTVLVGPSGCGKSTLLRLIAGLEEISDGDAYIGNTHINHVEPAKRDVAMVFQSYALYPHLTVADNISFHMKSKGIAKDLQRQKLKDVAQILGITHLLDRYPKDLSGGQRQRVAMGRAMVRNPKVFLFDEPLSNLDAQLRMELRAEIKSLHHQLKTTTVYVTHDQVEAMTLADQIVVMKDGEIIQQGDPLSIYDAPTNTFVARFIGSPPMNLLPGVVEHENGQWYANCLNIRVIIPAERVQSRLKTGQKIQIGIRPHQLQLTSTSQQPTATVNVVEITGDMTLIHATWQETRIYIQHHGRLFLHSGDSVHLELDRQAIHVFDEQGNRL
jgi:multiple sugar transport system ATP-binding protein